MRSLGEMLWPGRTAKTLNTENNTINLLQVSSVYFEFVLLSAGSCDSNWLLLSQCDDSSSVSHIELKYQGEVTKETGNDLTPHLSISRAGMILSAPAKERTQGKNSTSTDLYGIKIRTEICLLLNWAKRSEKHQTHSSLSKISDKMKLNRFTKSPKR